jgi:hypothetical protein
VNKLLLLLLMAMAVSAFMLPFFQTSGDLVGVDVYESDGAVILVGGKMQLELPFTGDGVYSSDDPLDFFPEIIDATTLQRVEFLPYGGGLECNVLTTQGRSVAGDYRFCLALAVKTDVPVFVQGELLNEPAFNLPKSL